MATYTTEYSSFPDTIMDTPAYKDVTDSVASLINQIRTYQNNGDYTSAYELITANPSLKDYVIGVDVINKLIEETRNAEVYAKTIKQSIYVTDDEPSSPINGDVWIGA